MDSRCTHVSAEHLRCESRANAKNLLFLFDWLPIRPCTGLGYIRLSAESKMVRCSKELPIGPQRTSHLEVASLQTGSVSAMNPKLAVLNVNFHGVTVANTAVQYLASQGDHKIGLNNAVERSCAVRRLVACRRLPKRLKSSR
jgi:hypothetical protein